MTGAMRDETTTDARTRRSNPYSARPRRGRRLVPTRSGYQRLATSANTRHPRFALVRVSTRPYFGCIVSIGVDRCHTGRNGTLKKVSQTRTPTAFRVASTGLSEG